MKFSSQIITSFDCICLTTRYSRIKSVGKYKLKCKESFMEGSRKIFCNLMTSTNENHERRQITRDLGRNLNW
jgi:hypothetical protein